MKRELEAESKNYRKYKGQPLMRGDVVWANVYFETVKRLYRHCDILRPHKNGVWIAWDRKGHREVMIEPEMVEKILIDEFYYRRREHPEKWRFYWEKDDK